MRKSKLTIQQGTKPIKKYKRTRGWVPIVSFQGKYLQEYGYNPGTECTIEVNEQQIIITKN